MQQQLYKAQIGIEEVRVSDSKDMIKLLENELFQKLIMERFIKQGIVTTVLDNSIDSRAVQDQLTARQVLHEYIFGTINTHPPED